MTRLVVFLISAAVGLAIGILLPWQVALAIAIGVSGGVVISNILEARGEV